MTEDASHLATPADIATAMTEAVIGFINELGRTVDEWDQQAAQTRTIMPSSRRAERAWLAGRVEALEELSRTLLVEQGVLLRALSPITDATFSSGWDAADRISDLAAEMLEHVDEELLAHWQRMRDIARGAVAASRGNARRNYEGGLHAVEEAIGSVASLNRDWGALVLVLAERLAAMEGD